MLVQAEIRFSRDHFEDGFGFSCMQAAYSHCIKGKMEYSTSSGVHMIVEGDSEEMDEFLCWLGSDSRRVERLILQKNELNKMNFKEFDIYRLV
jgi:hypothetical protein